MLENACFLEKTVKIVSRLPPAAGKPPRRTPAYYYNLVSVSQYNANSIAIFRHKSISINTTLPPFCRFLCVSLTVSYITLNQSAASMTLYKTTTFILAFYSSDDS